MRETYRAVQCPCGHRACKDWHVDPAASVQGVRFTEDQAKAVAALLNGEPPKRLREAVAILLAVVELSDRVTPNGGAIAMQGSLLALQASLRKNRPRILAWAREVASERGIAVEIPAANAGEPT